MFLPLFYLVYICFMYFFADFESIGNFREFIVVFVNGVVYLKINSVDNFYIKNSARHILIFFLILVFVG